MLVAASPEAYNSTTPCYGFTRNHLSERSLTINKLSFAAVIKTKFPSSNSVTFYLSVFLLFLFKANNFASIFFTGPFNSVLRHTGKNSFTL